MSDFGVTEAGFTLKGFDLILSESATRARQMFGADVDLSSTSPLRKILETTAMEDAELWKSMEDLYYSGFVSTATGASLDLLGEDLGLARRPLFAAGTAQFTLTGAAPGRQYIAPEGTIIETAPPSPAPSLAFFTLAPVVLSAAAPKAVVPAQAFLRGAGGNIGAGDLARVNPAYQVAELNFGGAALTVTNPQPFSGGETQEDDETYRARMLGYPRSIWTLESIRRAVLDVDGVIDVLLNDALGGVDASQSFFNLFSFNRRVFSRERQWSEPPYFDIVIAHEFGRPWDAAGGVAGIYDQALRAVDGTRPVGVHPNIVEADHIEVGLQAALIIESGADGQAILAAAKQRLAQDLGALRLGSDVLYSRVMAALVEQPGVRDAQNLRLRRCGAAFGRITFGAVPFQQNPLESAPGENLAMGPTEIAVFRADSPLNSLEVISQ